MNRFACGKQSSGNKPVFISIPSTALLAAGDGQPFVESEKAYGFQFSNAPVVWIPKSQVKDFEKNFDNLAIEFWLPNWLVENKNLGAYISTAYEPTFLLRKLGGEIREVTAIFFEAIFFALN